jgi:hypothetical protein
MDFGDVVTVMFGLLAFLEFTLLVIFGITLAKARPRIRSTKPRRQCQRPTQGRLYHRILLANVSEIGAAHQLR